MKKVSVVVMDKNKDAALDKLRELGIVHLERKTVASPELSKLVDRRTQVEMAVGVLRTFTPQKKNTPKKSVPSEAAVSHEYEGDLVSRIIELSSRCNVLQDQNFAAEREKQRFEKWGDFDPAGLAYLSGHGVNACLYDLSLASYEDNVGDVPVIVLSFDKKNNSVRLIAFNQIPNEVPSPLPDRALSAFDADIEVRTAEIARVKAEIIALTPLKHIVNHERTMIAEAVEYETAKAGMDVEAASISTGEGKNGGADLSFSWISGYVPASDADILKKTAGENGWAFCADDPAADDDEVPTKLKNSKLVGFIYPFLNFLDISPGYREVDISGWFLLFFTLFFGMIFGDAAYGAVLLVVSLACIGRTAKKGVPPVFGFLFLISSSNFLWGLLSGSWFGFDPSVVPQFLQNLSLPLIANVSAEPGWLESYNAGNIWIRAGLVAASTSVEAQSAAASRNLMCFCFSIALAQLGIGHLIGFIRNIKSLKFLAEIGQLCMLVGMYFVVLSLVVNNTGFGGVEIHWYYVLIAGFVLVFVFANYEDSVLKSLAASAANIVTVVLGVANVFSDIMSYIRLWAVGLAGAAIAQMVDGFAGPLLGHFIFFVFGIALFVFGHGFNMVLNVLSVLVHGVRLNTLEFSTHVGLTWSGFAYKPFAKR
ncbi:MAG: V-type ATP synthase subunit I [Spirochaetaceae bacterium]|nr:V-type ATP synthase subunit I [Spirochaetaceae bacterium]